ncbi:helix-turn-helix transcriptional regulator [Siphonobacter sp. BAB-5385]|uniref:helix-turn-helix domain-containing protein n=1 Tax=Siphonobacter sp. BAB-5385 TaxID=1864822 RepID=UPI0020CE0B5F|nr:helix-turn-helix transcriptional regulator [Siphonobacter sp. BAB-5385]
MMIMEGAFLVEVSRRIKERRTSQRLTVQELADRAGVSKGLISQIENGRSIPSLPVLFQIIQSLNSEVGDFFENLKLSEPVVLVQKKDSFEAFEKEDAHGFQYQRILTRSMAASTVDVVLLELAPHSQREEVRTEAFELKYILKGQVDYLINGQSYPWKREMLCFLMAACLICPVILAGNPARC